MSDADRRELLPNWLGASAEFVVARIPVQDNPRGIAVSPDGATVWVANTLDDSLSVIDAGKLQVASRVDLGGPKQRTHIRWGEQLFHSAKITFQRQFACATCHPDGHVDGLTYDIEADGIGLNPVDNRTLRGIYDTDPVQVVGRERDAGPAVRRAAGGLLHAPRAVRPRAAARAQRLHGHDPASAEPLSAARRAAHARPSAGARSSSSGRARTTGARSRTRGAASTATSRRTSRTASSGTSARSTRSTRSGKFDVPHLNNIYDSAPYLHNGMANTLEEIWTVHNPYDTHGVTNDMTKDQLNDLIEYLKTL